MFSLVMVPLRSFVTIVLRRGLGNNNNRKNNFLRRDAPHYTNQKFIKRHYKNEYLFYNVKDAPICATQKLFKRNCENGASKDASKEKSNVISYEDLLKEIKKPENFIIDVRRPEEVRETGAIPGSINIQASDVRRALSTMSHSAFREKYRREKPTKSDQLIFYCRSGNRAGKAMLEAMDLGYKNSKNYVGSWEEWSAKQKK